MSDVLAPADLLPKDLSSLDPRFVSCSVALAQLEEAGSSLTPVTKVTQRLLPQLWPEIREETSLLCGGCLPVVSLHPISIPFGVKTRRASRNILLHASKLVVQLQVFALSILLAFRNVNPEGRMFCVAFPLLSDIKILKACGTAPF